jgi:phosphohistidine phosphatase
MPDGLLCSPALRTHQTAELMRDGLGLHDSILREDSRLYLATANGIRTVLAATSDDLQCLLLVAHNPAISALASLLSAEAAQVALATAHYRVLQLQLTNWLQLGSR